MSEMEIMEAKVAETERALSDSDDASAAFDLHSVESELYVLIDSDIENIAQTEAYNFESEDEEQNEGTFERNGLPEPCLFTSDTDDEAFFTNLLPSTVSVNSLAYSTKRHHYLGLFSESENSRSDDTSVIGALFPPKPQCAQDTSAPRSAFGVTTLASNKAADLVVPLYHVRPENVIARSDRDNRSTTVNSSCTTADSPSDVAIESSSKPSPVDFASSLSRDCGNVMIPVHQISYTDVAKLPLDQFERIYAPVFDQKRERGEAVDEAEERAWKQQCGLIGKYAKKLEVFYNQPATVIKTEEPKLQQGTIDLNLGEVLRNYHFYGYF